MKILVKDGGLSPYEVDIEGFGKEVVSFGRQPDNDIVLKAQGASRIHGCFYRENGILYIEDMNSTNGICSNGHKISRKKVNEGDVFEIHQGGKVCVSFVCGNALAFQETASQPYTVQVHPISSYNQPQYNRMEYQSEYNHGYNPYPPQGYQENKPVSGLAIASFVLGILSLLTMFVFPFPAVLTGLFALLFASMSMRNNSKGGKGFAIAGLVCGLIGCLPMMWYLILRLRIALYLNSL